MAIWFCTLQWVSMNEVILSQDFNLNAVMKHLLANVSGKIKWRISIVSIKIKWISVIKFYRYFLSKNVWWPLIWSESECSAIALSELHAFVFTSSLNFKKFNCVRKNQWKNLQEIVYIWKSKGSLQCTTSINSLYL